MIVAVILMVGSVLSLTMLCAGDAQTDPGWKRRPDNRLQNNSSFGRYTFTKIASAMKALA
jgi:hypothetical protein